MHKLKADALNVVYAAVSRGTLFKLPCYICESLETKLFHFDYWQQRRVRWLCKVHAVEHNPIEPIPIRPMRQSSTTNSASSPSAYLSS